MAQVNLKGMLEFTATCGFLFAIGPPRDLILYGIAFGVTAIWTLRITRWALRWLLFNWMLALSSIFFGMACLERAFQGGGVPGVDSVGYWLLCGCAMIAWTPLAVINGFLFLVEVLNRDPTGQQPAARLRRNATG